MQAKKKGILTPETAHAVQQCWDPPNSKSDSQLPAAAARPHPVEAIFFLPDIDDEDDENCADIRVSVIAEKEADKLSNDKDGRDSDIRSIVKFWGCMTGRFMPRSGGMMDSEPVLTSYKILTPLFRGWASPAELSGGAAITPEVLQLAMSKITGDVANILKTFSDFSFWIAD